jgi:deoxyribonuclease-4
MDRFGAQMSVAGGVDKAFERAERVGCGAMQIFTKNANRWQGRPLDPGEIERFRAHARRTGIGPILSHDSYLINLGSGVEALRARSLEALIDELERAEALGLDYLVVHPGAAAGGREEDCLKLIAEGLDHVHARTAGYRVRILLENTAGQGTCVGHRLEHLAGLLARAREPERLGVCLDTCHLFAAGYDLSREDPYAKTMHEVETVLGIERVKAFHLNDCKKPLGSRVDRHEHIGEGFIGREGFRLLVNDPRFRGLPMILETPKGEDGYSMDVRNLKLLRRLASAPAAARSRAAAGGQP